MRSLLVFRWCLAPPPFYPDVIFCSFRAVSIVYSCFLLPTSYTGSRCAPAQPGYLTRHTRRRMSWPISRYCLPDSVVPKALMSIRKQLVAPAARLQLEPHQELSSLP